MPTSTIAHRIAAALLCSTLLCAAPAGPAAAETFQLTDRIAVPGKPLASYDLSFVDPATRRYYLADRSNASVDVVDIASRTLVAQIGGFVGAVDKGPKSGPDGVMTIPGTQELWVGDGDSSVKIVDLAQGTGKIVATISTGGTARVDGVAYDPVHDLVLVANNADEPPFLSLIDRKSRAVLARAPVPEATDGIEQPAFVAETGLFYFSVPALGDVKNRGAVGVFDPVAKAVTQLIPLDGCLPAGMAHGPGTKLVLGCDAGSPESGLPPTTMIFDVKTKEVTTIHDVGSSDQVWYSPGTNLYYVAARGMAGGPVLGVIDAKTEKWLQNVPTVPKAYSVAADADTATALMPLPPHPACPSGCIGVFSRR